MGFQLVIYIFSLLFCTIALQGLRDEYSKYDEVLKVDRIIVLASATEEVPINLIRCVREAARPSAGDTNNRGEQSCKEKVNRS